MKENFYISTVDVTDEYHRSKIIIHRPDMYYFAEFDTMEQLTFFADMLGFTFKLDKEEKQTNCNGTYRTYTISHTFNDPYCGGFWKRSDVPSEAKPFKALSNGSIVTCYFTNDGETISIFRPNPNATEVYHPLGIEEHIKHTKIYGSY